MIKTLKIISLLFIIVIICNKCYSQRTGYIGLNFTMENSSGSFRPGIGGIFERQVTRHSGVETGVYYRTYIQNTYLIYTDSSGSRSLFFTISEKHISIPVQYKFYSRLVNFSVGPSFDFYLGWKQKNKSSLVTVNEHNINPDFFIGLLAKVSKKINLSKQFVLEPEVRLNPIFTLRRRYIGFGIAGKYKL